MIAIDRLRWSWSSSIVPFVDRHRALAAPAADRGRRPVARQLAGVGDVVAAARAQLHVAAADPLRAAGVRPALEQPPRRRRAPGTAARPLTPAGRRAPRRRRGREARDAAVGRRRRVLRRDRRDLLGRRRRPGGRLAAADGDRARRARRRLDLGLAPAPPPRPGRRTAPTPTPPTTSASSASIPTASLRPLALGVGHHAPPRSASCSARGCCSPASRSSPRRSPCSSGTPTDEITGERASVHRFWSGQGHIGRAVHGESG